MQRNILNTYLRHVLSFKKMNSHLGGFSHSSFSILCPATTYTKCSHACFIKLEPLFCISPPKRNHALFKRPSKEKSNIEVSVESLTETVEAKTGSSVDLKDLTKNEKKIIPKPKCLLCKRVLDEIMHYYHGFQRLGNDIKIATRIIWKILLREELSRRERQQLARTTSDIFRLVPFLVFIGVPFMELLLPIFIKLFPQMLPSSFESASEQEKKFKAQLKVERKAVELLQEDLVDLSVKPPPTVAHISSVKEFSSFLEKIRSSGEIASNEDISKYSKLFEDELTLDHLKRSSLIALCHLLELNPIGSNNLLRFKLRMRLRSLKYDDKLILKDGIDSLTVSELQSACRARGMRALGLSENRLKSQLEQWLELSLNKEIPPSLLLLSRALYLSDSAVEINDTEELTEDFPIDQIHPKQNIYKTKLSKPEDLSNDGTNSLVKVQAD